MNLIFKENDDGGSQHWPLLRIVDAFRVVRQTRPRAHHPAQRNAPHLTELFRLTNPDSEDCRNLLHMLKTEKPVFWDSEAGWLRTAHPKMHDAEPVGAQEGH